MSPVEGDVRVNPSTGDYEIYRDGVWVLYIEFDPAERDAPVDLRSANEWERPTEKPHSEE